MNKIATDKKLIVIFGDSNTSDYDNIAYAFVDTEDEGMKLGRANGWFRYKFEDAKEFLSWGNGQYFANKVKEIVE